MKKTRKLLSFVLTLAMTLTMLAGMTLTVSASTVSASTQVAFLSALKDPDVDVINLSVDTITLPETIVIDRTLYISGGTSNRVIKLDKKLPANTRHFIVTGTGNLELSSRITLEADDPTMDGANWKQQDKGGIDVLGGTLTVSHIIHVGNSTLPGGGAIFADGGTVTVYGNIQHTWAQEGNGGGILAINGSTININNYPSYTINANYAPNGRGGSIAADASSTVNIININPIGSFSNAIGGPSGGGITAWGVTGGIKYSVCEVCGKDRCECPADTDIPDPVPLASVSGDAGITITRPDPMLPFLVNPESAQAKELFTESDILGGTGFNFGEHKYTSAPQEINSLNSLSMIYGYLDPFNEIFTVTCEISDFLMEDDTPLFTDFSLYMGRQNNYFDRDFESEYYASSKAKVYESKASFDLAKNDPVVVVKTDAVGHVLTNYIGVLKLQQDTTKTVGQANATITWEIGIEVI